MPLRRLLRACASLLATVALASATARPVMACEMGRAAMPVADAAASAPAIDPHAHHAMSDAPADVTPTEAPAPAPTMPACDHLVGCAAMVVTSAPTVDLVPVTVPESSPRWTSAQPDAPVIALEPPPPRA